MTYQVEYLKNELLRISLSKQISRDIEVFIRANYNGGNLLANKVFEIKGIMYFITEKYNMTIEKFNGYEWSDLIGLIVESFESYYGEEFNEILPRIKSTR